MRVGRRSRIAMAVATCLLSIPLTMWVVSRSHSGDGHLQAAGEDVHADIAPSPALSTASLSEQAPAWPDRTDADGAPPMVAPVAPPAALPSSLGAAPPAEKPPVVPSRTSAVVPPRGSIAAELETRTRGALQQLDGFADGAGSPMEWVARLLTFLEQQQCPGGTCRAAQGAIEAYLRTRTELIRAMLEAFLASDGVYDGAHEQQELQALHAAFTAEMAPLATQVPMLAQLPDILATTLRVPDYLEVAADDTRESPSLSHGDGTGVHGPHALPPLSHRAAGRPW